MWKTKYLPKFVAKSLSISTIVLVCMLLLLNLLKQHVRTEDKVNSLAIVVTSFVRVMVDNISTGDVKYRIATNSHG